ncbi:MAG TPA: outer membrane beta-barrel protein [Cyclobacteriaceae bacterium]|nr:outer membrane beta-barrel protein [Cyclobacteriaceae bacterium]
MFRLNLLLILLSSATSVFSQKNYVGLSFNVINSYRTEDSNYEYLNPYGKEIISWEAGVTYDRQLLNRFYISSGILYSTKGYDTKPFISFYSEKHRYNYIEIPLGIKYSAINSKRIRLNIKLEMRNQFLIQAVYTPYDFLVLPFYMGSRPTAQKETKDYQELKDQGFNMYNIGVGGGIEVLYKISNTLYIGLAPNANYSLKPITSKGAYYEPPNEKLYSYGIELKVIYSFGKK